MKRHPAARRHDQAAIRSSGEGRDAAFDLASVAHANGVHLDPERLRCGLDGAERTDPGRTVGIPKERFCDKGVRPCALHWKNFRIAASSNASPRGLSAGKFNTQANGA